MNAHLYNECQSLDSFTVVCIVSAARESTVIALYYVARLHVLHSFIRLDCAEHPCCVRVYVSTTNNIRARSHVDICFWQKIINPVAGQVLWQFV